MKAPGPGRAGGNPLPNSARRRLPAGSRPDRPDAQLAGLAARRAAFLAVVAVIRAGAALDEALGPAVVGLDPRDEALARAVAVTTFRRFGSIWAALEGRLARGMPEDERALAILATGAAQILFLDVPDRAAVDLAVTLARTEPNLSYAAGLTNAVLRRLSRERDAVLAEVEPPLTDAPSWLAERWRGAYGGDVASAIAAAHRLGAAVDVTVKSDPEGWAARLGGTLLPTGSVRLPERAGITSLPGFAEGAWWVQDAAAALPVRLLGAGPGQRVADLCAAPGGKAAQLAAAGAHVTAVDRSAARIERLAANMARLNLAIETVVADALDFEAPAFDGVLLDAPCTATGTLRRHPDVAWTKRAGDLASLIALQSRLLDRAAVLVRPGGTLVYCVCSLEPEEGEGQVAAFLARQPAFALVPVRPDELDGQSQFLDATGQLRTRPDMWAGLEGSRSGLDGFFAARLSRRSA